MTATIYLPRNLAALQREIADVHAEAVVRQVERLACPVEQKREIVRRVQEKVHNQNISINEDSGKAVA